MPRVVLLLLLMRILLVRGHRHTHAVAEGVHVRPRPALLLLLIRLEGLLLLLLAILRLKQLLLLLLLLPLKLLLLRRHCGRRGARHPHQRIAGGRALAGKGLVDAVRRQLRQVLWEVQHSLFDHICLAARVPIGTKGQSVLRKGRSRHVADRVDNDNRFGFGAVHQLRALFKELEVGQPLDLVHRLPPRPIVITLVAAHRTVKRRGIKVNGRLDAGEGAAATAAARAASCNGRVGATGGAHPSGAPSAAAGHRRVVALAAARPRVTKCAGGAAVRVRSRCVAVAMMAAVAVPMVMTAVSVVVVAVAVAVSVVPLAHRADSRPHAVEVN